jgi:hypothetical protein
MEKPAELTKVFEAHRSHLRAVAYRMLGSLTEADDAVQKAWLKLADISGRQIRSGLSFTVRATKLATAFVSRLHKNSPRSQSMIPCRRDTGVSPHQVLDCGLQPLGIV